MGNKVSASVDDSNSITNENDIWWFPLQYQSSPSSSSQQQQQQQQQLQQQTSTKETLSLLINENDNENDNKIIKLRQFTIELDKKHLARRQIIADKCQEIQFLKKELIKYKEENALLKDELFIIKDINNLPSSSEPKPVSVPVQALTSAPVSPSLLDEMKMELDRLNIENVQLKDKLNKTNEITNQNSQLQISIAKTQKDLQIVNAQLLQFQKEKHDYETHIVALKDVIRISKHLLEIRENQLEELQRKITNIETSLAEKELSIMSTNLKNEYERQLENIRTLRTLYEQRQIATKAERDLIASQLTDIQNNLDKEKIKNQELQERIIELEANVSKKYDEIKNLESQLGLTKAEYRGLEAEMTAVNQLFSQILFDFNNCQQEIDFDKLIKVLEENHDLLTNIVINEESEAMSSILPKVLLNLVNQVNKENEENEKNKYSELNEIDMLSSEEQHLYQYTNTIMNTNTNTMNSAEEIVNKLPKVWRVLIELLRQQCGQQTAVIDIQNGTNYCYKSVETPKGPKLVLSVSKTFIRLKDLILEKKSLEKQMIHLKQLNTHLESRLQDQEKRLETVSNELNKTWNVAGKMHRQHEQLHTHEKVLRYELAQKRKMLTELKEELECCREKWEQARKKNTNTEEEWRKLRNEFASRKVTTILDELNNTNSTESGYSDEHECFTDVDDDNVNVNDKDKKIINNNNNSNTCSTIEERLQQREERLKKLEEQCHQLVTKITNTSNRSTQINNRLEILHKQYGK